MKNHKSIGFLRNTCLDSLKNTKLPSQLQCWAIISTRAKRHFNCITMAFRWRVDDGPLIVVFGSSLPSSTKKPKKKNPKNVNVGPPPLTKLWIRARKAPLKHNALHPDTCQILFFLQVVVSNAELLLKLVKFHNPTGYADNGNCCEGLGGGSCSYNCDPFIKVCIDIP